ncbi:hypothetical protein [Mycobacterium branderi]|uniref:Lipoprotein LprH n=1 Tax=Mycobacterium branderi TaxID=43348 RepID=A0AA91LTQ8_9MYCO|nr:hypothetical protein [Mycobacterium branderi]MCV7232237.1 hypothetical protein [Mycobacterium branderi]ORA33765.1 hypothetical protein BST20_21225 [Mycobacterium branderi]
MAAKFWAAGVALLLAACTTLVPGHPTTVPGPPPAPHKPMPSARDLLLHDGDRTPMGPATAASRDDELFTGARPPECAAALAFKDSPLLPVNASDHADSSYRVGSSALYAESVDVYGRPLDPHDVVWNSFSAVSACSGEAVGVTAAGDSAPMRLRRFAVADDGVLVWAMNAPGRTCDYGLAVVPRAALLMTACDIESGIDIDDWASTRRQQLLSRVA